tara:strand:+ start:114 stop:1217 length:1104 start_codon:yes stop_codon:yes gene_type:complete
MGYNILGINLSHNSSVCILSDGEISYFLEEERLSKSKSEEIPLHSLANTLPSLPISEIVISGLSGYYNNLYYLKSINFLLKKFYPEIPINTKFINHHHSCHSAISFYNSGFKNCLSVVIDGNGDFSKENHKEKFKGFETETITTLKYPFNSQRVYKSYLTDVLNKTSYNTIFSTKASLTKIYEGVTRYLGFTGLSEAGKTMGLSSYGKSNDSIPSLYLNSKGNPDIIENDYKSANLKLPPNSKDWHKDSSKITDFEKDLSYKVQQESQQEVGNLIEKGLKETGLKQVCCAGGYFLNCVANYYLTKRFPDVEFYFEPISSDAGNAIGVAKLAWHKKTQDINIRPQKTIYYGPKYTKEELLKGIQKYLD